MRKFQRVAVVAAAVAGLSAFGAGAGTASAHEGGWDGPDITAVATSQANAVATWGAPHGKHSAPHRAAAPEAAPQAAAPQPAPQAAPQAAPYAPQYAAPEGFGEYSTPYIAK
ncbi:hypothetical protein OG828_27255 [Streptomyces sp. NBC_00457]|uniref:hypothetical protein n=1 Tax=unclassified Streptomyces TaxID=2593676 RepID=UPI002E205457|nr:MULTISPECIES: hypothetical protein [unclassified Streptomyces]